MQNNFLKKKIIKKFYTFNTSIMKNIICCFSLIKNFT